MGTNFCENLILRFFSNLPPNRKIFQKSSPEIFEIRNTMAKYFQNGSNLLQSLESAKLSCAKKSHIDAPQKLVPEKIAPLRYIKSFLWRERYFWLKFMI